MNEFTADTARDLGGPSWLLERRTAAAEQLAITDLPTTASEEWRYSPIAEFDLQSYRLASVPVLGPDDDSGSVASTAVSNGASRRNTGFPQALVDRLTDGFDEDVFDDLPAEGVAGIVDIVNGVVIRIEGFDELASQGVTVTPVGAATDGLARLGSVVQRSGDFFTLMNDAFAAGPVVIDVKDSTVVDGTIVVRHFAVGRATASFPRLVVRIGRNAQAKLLDLQRSSDAVFTAPVVELDVRAAGRLGYLNVQQHHRKAWQIAYHAARVEQDASLVSAVVGLGGGYARTRASTALVGRGATGDLLSGYFGSGSQVLDFRTFQDHAAPDTTSNLLYLGAVGESARSVYTGLIRVRPNARGTNAFQTNRNLKLSEDAWAESVPNLEIENNDVRCSHASTVGPVDPDHLYYLESRGVPTTVAERLIVAGFFEDVLTALPVPLAEAPVRAAITNKLDRLSSLGKPCSDNP